MQIAHASVDMRASHVATESRTVSERLRAWIGERPDFEVASSPSAIVHLSEAAKTTPPQSSAPEEEPSDMDYAPDLLLIKMLIEQLTGREIKTVKSGDITRTPVSPELRDPNDRPSRPDVGWGLEYDYRESRTESERTTYSASGVVRTGDGKEIAFSIELTMSREFRQEIDVSLREGDAVRKDPLVLNFGESGARLNDIRLRFDLDGDGIAEEVPLLDGASAYLVLDRNGNAKVDDGRELFGPATGDGFQELRALDADGNHWIDDNDPAFSRLFLWRPGDADRLTSVRDAGVGALYLGRVSTPFELRDSANGSLGAIRTSGVYLTEQGKAGTLQQIDLTI